MTRPRARKINTVWAVLWVSRNGWPVWTPQQSWNDAIEMAVVIRCHQLKNFTNELGRLVNE